MKSEISPGDPGEEGTSEAGVLETVHVVHVRKGARPLKELVHLKDTGLRKSV
jgi:hypothetical protein